MAKKPIPNPCSDPGCPGCPTVPVEVEARLAAYATPTTLTAEDWAALRARLLCLVRRTEPVSPNTAAMRLAALCAVCATVDIDSDASLGEVLSVPTINSFLAGRRAQIGGRPLANLSAILRRLRCTALGLPYRAANTPDPQALSARQRNKVRPEPSEANRLLIVEVCRPVPVLVSILTLGLTNHRLEKIQPHLPSADLCGHIDVLRGETTEGL